MGTHRTDILTAAERLSPLGSIAGLTRQLAAVENELIAALQREAIPAELGDGLANTLAPVSLTSRQVCWPAVHEHVLPLLTAVGSRPMIGVKYVEYLKTQRGVFENSTWSI